MEKYFLILEADVSTQIEQIEINAIRRMLSLLVCLRSKGKNVFENFTPKETMGSGPKVHLVFCLLNKIVPMSEGLLQNYKLLLKSPGFLKDVEKLRVNNDIDVAYGLNMMYSKDEDLAYRYNLTVLLEATKSGDLPRLFQKYNITYDMQELVENFISTDIIETSDNFFANRSSVKVLPYLRLTRSSAAYKLELEKDASIKDIGDIWGRFIFSYGIDDKDCFDGGKETVLMEARFFHYFAPRVPLCSSSFEGHSRPSPRLRKGRQDQRSFG